jgi:UDP-GlcNAc3NAcA epimerase
LKVLTVVGARPQFIKAAPVSRALRSIAGIREFLVHTGQHYDENMSRLFFSELDIPEPHLNLGIGSGPHGQQTGRMLAALERAIVENAPDWVLVYGDTNSTLAGALAAAKLKVRVAHIEAGLRSFNREMPEEINRVLTDHASDLLFAPTATAIQNLADEGISRRKVVRSGDVMYDAALNFAERAEKRSRILESLGLTAREFVLVTVHRAENTDDRTRLCAIFDALARLAREITVVLPLHPRTRAALGSAHIREIGNLKLLEPVGYLDMVMLEQHAALIATDSGGVQKEAFFYRVPCVTLRTETEWVELVQAGWNRLAPPRNGAALYRALRAALSWRPPRTAARIYGDGNAARKIAAALAACTSRAR